MNADVKNLMIEFRNQIPNINSLSWHQWTKIILENGTPYYQHFYNLLSQFPENVLRQIYKNF